ncbi:MAG TPA: hypothetical protein VKA27_02165 [Sunxiuqinia sp.]|nr:hypothetical protein [Sunxiuqinia sp.]
MKNIVPWGRNLSEYQQFFQLTDEDLDRLILSCADGPASFNAELKTLGGNCISIDPIYAFTTEQIKQRIDETSIGIYNQLLLHQNDYNWDYYQTPEVLLKIRLDAMNHFLSDYEDGRISRRYRNGGLPTLNSIEQEFELVLCSHFLFTYSDHLTTEFHIQSILEMLKKGNELRIFPVCKIDGKPSVHLQKVIDFLNQSAIHFQFVKVNYEFQKGGNTMLQIFKN